MLIGLPALVLTTTTPLVSGWFQAARDERRRRPVLAVRAEQRRVAARAARLPAAHRAAPRPGARSAAIWTVGYAGSGHARRCAAIRVLPTSLRDQRPRRDRRRRRRGGVDRSAAAAIDWPRRLRWLLLAAIPSGLLSAVTTFIATDLVSAPLLWVLPLAIYLASFIVAFSPRGGRPIRLAVVAAPAMITLLWVPYGSAGGWPILVDPRRWSSSRSAIVAIALHGRLAQDRPDPAHLTEFYLILSTGGALASAFVALVAPQRLPGRLGVPDPAGRGARRAGARRRARGRAPPRRRRGLDFSPFFAGFRGRMLPYVVGAVLAGRRPRRDRRRWRPRPASAGCSSAG